MFEAPLETRRQYPPTGHNGISRLVSQRLDDVAGRTPSPAAPGQPRGGRTPSKPSSPPPRAIADWRRWGPAADVSEQQDQAARARGLRRVSGCLCHGTTPADSAERDVCTALRADCDRLLHSDIQGTGHVIINAFWSCISPPGEPYQPIGHDIAPSPPAQNIDRVPPQCAVLAESCAV